MSSSNRGIETLKRRKVALSLIALGVFAAGALYVSYCIVSASSVMKEIQETMSELPHELKSSSDLSPLARYFSPTEIGDNDPVTHYVSNADCYFAVFGVNHGRMWLHTEISTKDAGGIVSNVVQDSVELSVERMAEGWRVTGLDWRL